MRALDISLSLFLMTITSPIFLIVGVAILLESGPPVFFAQRRVGQFGRTFLMYKFRSMRKDAPTAGPFYTEKNDPRITKIGKFIRRTSIDELPQLWNVLVGDMSFVGPRPYLERQMNELDPEVARRRNSVRPGITGLAQIRGRSMVAPEVRLEYDLEYVARRSLALNLRIILLTAGQVLIKKGVN